MDESIFTSRDYNIFQQLLGTHDMPDSLKEVYYKYKKMMDKIDAPFSPSMLVMMVFEAQEDSPAEKEPVKKAKKPPKTTKKKTKDDNGFAPGDTVDVFYDGDILTGKIVGSNDDNTLYQVEVDDEDEPIEVEVDKISEL